MTEPSWITHIRPSRRHRLTVTTKLSRAEYRDYQSLALTYRQPPTPIRQVIEKTVNRQTIQKATVHLHQSTIHHHVHRQYMEVRALSQNAFLVLLQRERLLPGEPADLSRPTRSAQRLLKIFSKESARRELRPFYSSVVRDVLRQEQERYRNRPTQAISLIWNLFGRQQAFRTLTRFYMSAVEKLGSNYYPSLSDPNALFLAANVLFHSRLYRQETRSLWRHETMTLPVRYVPQERVVMEDHLQVLRRVIPPRELVEKVAEEPSEAVRDAPAAENPVHLSEADFQALVRGVAQSLGRETRLEALRRGRY